MENNNFPQCCLGGRNIFFRLHIFLHIPATPKFCFPFVWFLLTTLQSSLGREDSKWDAILSWCPDSKNVPPLTLTESLTFKLIPPPFMQGGPHLHCSFLKKLKFFILLLCLKKVSLDKKTALEKLKEHNEVMTYHM